MVVMMIEIESDKYIRESDTMTDGRQMLKSELSGQ
jgi:hypothetical protein